MRDNPSRYIKLISNLFVCIFVSMIALMHSKLLLFRKHQLFQEILLMNYFYKNVNQNQFLILKQKVLDIEFRRGIFIRFRHKDIIDQICLHISNTEKIYFQKTHSGFWLKSKSLKCKNKIIVSLQYFPIIIFSFQYPILLNIIKSKRRKFMLKGTWLHLDSRPQVSRSSWFNICFTLRKSLSTHPPAVRKQVGL